MTETALPGQAIASIEEYEAGENAFDDGDKVRSAVVGTVSMDGGERVANVQRANGRPIPKAGDTVIGTVAAVMSSMMAITIRYVNGAPTHAGVECICSTRNQRRRTMALVNDVMVLRIISSNNGALHATAAEPRLGVLLTKCRKCAGPVSVHRDAVKCDRCGWIDDRKLSSDFGKAEFLR